MKPVLTLFAGMMLSAALFSCSTSKVSIVQRKADMLKSKELGQGCFVQKKDGTIENYQTLVLVTGIMKSPYLLADGKKHIAAGEIMAYQNQVHYAISQTLFTEGRKSFVAVETLPGFAVRTSKGNINVYCKKYYNGKYAVDEFFLQGKDGGIHPYSCEIMNELLKSDPAAMHFFNDHTQPMNFKEKLMATAAMHNERGMAGIR